MSKVHLIGNAHIDPVWLWRWQDGVAEVLATFRSALDRMKEFPDFKFTSACAVYYEWVEKIDPEMFKEIQNRVKEGRWNIVGGWYLQPDCNIPCGESFARHALVSQRYFKDKFGITAKTGYNVDSFGHNANLPKILKLSGMDNYVFMRPFPEEQGRDESLFIWESDDGSQVKTYRIPQFYNIDTTRLDVLTQIKEKAEKENTDLMAFYGVGNHGGGPTIELIDAINKMNIKDSVYSTPDKYFETVGDNLPVIKDELQHHARGCYSVETYVKTANRKCEQNLLAAEKLCTVASELVGDTYPKDELNKAWKNVLFNQFHDILCGCSIKAAYEDAGHLYGETMSITQRAINNAMQKIAWNIDTLQGETLPSYKAPNQIKIWEHETLGTPIVVFNTHSWPVRMNVDLNAVAKKMTDSNGNEIPFQIVRGKQTNNDDKYETSFMAEVPPLGYAVYRLFTSSEGNAFETNLTVTENSLENDRIKVELSPVTGDICYIYDKGKNITVIDTPCKAVVLDETDCDTWAHNKKSLGETVGMFDTPEFMVIENGPVRATIRVVTKYNNSTIQRDYTIFNGCNHVKVKVKADFHEKHRALKFTFPLTDETVIAKIPYGTITRTGYTGEEPCGSWFASGNLCVANDSKYGYDTEDGEMRLTVLRSAIYADHFGQRDEFCEFMEQGIHEFCYTLFPYENNAIAEKKASELNFGLLHLTGSFHHGKLPESYCGLECDNENVIVSAIKHKEDSNEKVIRLYEMNSENTHLSLKLFEKEINTDITHNQVKTFTDDGVELDLTEWEK